MAMLALHRHPNLCRRATQVRATHTRMLLAVGASSLASISMNALTCAHAANPCMAIPRLPLTVNGNVNKLTTKDILLHHCLSHMGKRCPLVAMLSLPPVAVKRQAQPKGFNSCVHLEDGCVVERERIQ